MGGERQNISREIGFKIIITLEWKHIYSLKEPVAEKLKI